MKSQFLTKRLSIKEKPSNILRSKKSYDLKISQSTIYVKEFFYMFFHTLRDIIQADSEEWFSFNVNFNASLKFLWCPGTCAFGGHSELTQRALGHLRHSGTGAPKVLGHSGTGTLKVLEQLGTQGTLFSRLVSMSTI